MKIRSVFISAALGIGLLVSVPGQATATTTPTPTVAPIPASDVYEAQVVAATNAHRVAKRKVRLTTQRCLDVYAERHAYWMATHRKLKHQNMRTILKGCKLRSVGENIAYGFRSGPLTTSAWMRSAGHRKNILKAKYRLIAVGAYQDKYGRWWVSQVFGRK